MNFKEQYFQIWQQGWGIHKRFYGIRQQDEERWKELNNECEQLDRQCRNRPEQRFLQSLLLAIVGELERSSKDAETAGTTTTQP